MEQLEEYLKTVVKKNIDVEEVAKTVKHLVYVSLGKATSDLKKRTSAENGKKGGRPRKSAKILS